MGEFVLRLVALVPSPSHPPSYRRRFRRRPPFETTATLEEEERKRRGRRRRTRKNFWCFVTCLAEEKKNYRTLGKP